MKIVVAGKNLCKHFRIIVQIEIWDNDSDKFTLSIGKNLCKLILFVTQSIKSL